MIPRKRVSGFVITKTPVFEVSLQIMGLDPPAGSRLAAIDHNAAEDKPLITLVRWENLVSPNPAEDHELVLRRTLEALFLVGYTTVLKPWDGEKPTTGRYAICAQSAARKFMLAERDPGIGIVESSMAHGGEWDGLYALDLPREQNDAIQAYRALASLYRSTDAVDGFARAFALGIEARNTTR